MWGLRLLKRKISKEGAKAAKQLKNAQTLESFHPSETMIFARRDRYPETTPHKQVCLTGVILILPLSPKPLCPIEGLTRGLWLPPQIGLDCNVEQRKVLHSIAPGKAGGDGPKGHLQIQQVPLKHRCSPLTRSMGEGEGTTPPGVNGKFLLAPS